MPLSARQLIYIGVATQAAEDHGLKLVELNLDGFVPTARMTPKWLTLVPGLQFYDQRELDEAKEEARRQGYDSMKPVAEMARSEGHAAGRAEMEAEMLERIATATTQALAEGERRAMERMQPIFDAIKFAADEAMIAQAQGTFHDNDGQQDGGSANLNGGDADVNSDQPGPDGGDADAGPDESDILTLEANLFGIKVSARAVFTDDAVTVSASIGGMVLINLTIRDATNREPSPDGAQPDPDGTTDA
jgi:hypothetical protein